MSSRINIVNESLSAFSEKNSTTDGLPQRPVIHALYCGYGNAGNCTSSPWTSGCSSCASPRASQSVKVLRIS